MKKYYQFGEIMLALREEYRDCKHLLEELKDCVSPELSVNDYYFTGLLAHDLSEVNVEFDRKIVLYTMKEYNKILKKIHDVTGNRWWLDLYSAAFYAEKQENGLYGIKQDNSFSPYENRRYRPEVEIIDKEKFSSLIEKLLTSDIMHTQGKCFEFNHDSIMLEFDYAAIQSSLGWDSRIIWNGETDRFDYSIAREESPYLIESIFELEIPAEKISEDWLKILEKHEDMFDKELLFSVDENVQSRKGTLQLHDIEKCPNFNVVEFVKKPKR